MKKLINDLILQWNLTYDYHDPVYSLGVGGICANTSKRSVTYLNERNGNLFGIFFVRQVPGA